MLILCCPQSHLLVFLKNKIVFPLKWRQYSGNNIIQILDVVTQTSRAICLVWDRLASREGRSHNVNATASDYHPYFLCSISPSRMYYCITTASAKIKKSIERIKRENRGSSGERNSTSQVVWTRPRVLFEKFYFFFFFSISYNNTDVTEYIVLQTQSTPPPWLLLLLLP